MVESVDTDVRTTAPVPSYKLTFGSGELKVGGGQGG